MKREEKSSRGLYAAKSVIILTLVPELINGIENVVFTAIQDITVD